MENEVKNEKEIFGKNVNETITEKNWQVFDKLKLNLFNVISITLSVIAIIMSLVAINTNVRRRDMMPRGGRFAYERNIESNDRFNGMQRNEGPRIRKDRQNPNDTEIMPPNGGDQQKTDGQRSKKRIFPKGNRENVKPGTNVPEGENNLKQKNIEKPTNK